MHTKRRVCVRGFRLAQDGCGLTCNPTGASSYHGSCDVLRNLRLVIARLQNLQFVHLSPSSFCSRPKISQHITFRSRDRRLLFVATQHRSDALLISLRHGFRAVPVLAARAWPSGLSRVWRIPPRLYRCKQETVLAHQCRAQSASATTPSAPESLGRIRWPDERLGWRERCARRELSTWCIPCGGSERVRYQPRAQARLRSLSSVFGVSANWSHCASYTREK